MYNFKKSAVFLSIILTACGGGSNSTSAVSNTVDTSNASGTVATNPAPTNSGATVVTEVTPVVPAVVVPQAPPTVAQASSFLLRSTMGVKAGDAQKVVDMGYVNWINNQFSMPHTATKDRVDAQWNAQKAATGSASQSQNWYYQAWWQGAIADDDQLRQRVNWALSQIFVVSFINDAIPGRVRGVANYYDILGRHSFGNFKDLLNDISLNPMMGFYLTFMRNSKEDLKIGRTPDENYAREVMQLFTIGLYELNLDGSIKTDASGLQIYTYTNKDVSELARVFTGLSFGLPNTPWYGVNDPEDDIVPMKLFPAFHSSGTKTFLGKSGTTVSDAVDILFNHPNVAPFFTKQLIQKLVTSNPSPAYIERVAKVFNDNGKGVRGDMKSVIMAILVDPEANIQTDYSGKLKEPLLRMTNYYRATGSKSNSGLYNITNTDDTSYPKLTLKVLKKRPYTNNQIKFNLDFINLLTGANSPEWYDTLYHNASFNYDISKDAQNLYLKISLDKILPEKENKKATKI